MRSLENQTVAMWPGGRRYNQRPFIGKLVGCSFPDCWHISGPSGTWVMVGRSDVIVPYKQEV